MADSGIRVPTINVITRESDPQLFDELASTMNEGDLPEATEYYAELCERAKDLEAEPYRVGFLADEASYILELVSYNEVVTFAYLNTETGTKPYAYLILLCGSYDFEHGTTVWKGSEVLIDKAMELARVAGKTSLRLEALNETLYKKVYEPMGFKPVPGEHLIYERPLPSGGKKTRRRNRRQRKTRARKTKVRGKK
jgi:hypothetical protein